MLIIQGQTFAEVYQKILDSLINKPQFVSKPRGQTTHEIMNCVIQIEDPTSNMIKNVVRSTPKRYLAGELFWYFSGRRDVETIRRYSKFWDKLINPDGQTVNSAYGYLLFKEYHAPLYESNIALDGINEWQWALQSLIKDKDSRQAIIRFNKPWHSWWGNKDFVCTLNGVFNIRDDKLHLTIIMRSQDEIFGRTFDVPFFTLLQQQMLVHLKRVYPELSLGSYVQHNISTHLYERDFDKATKMLQHKFNPAGLPKLQSNLINENGFFNLDKFKASDDELIKWIKLNMEVNHDKR